jgi:hypothetical protein
MAGITRATSMIDKKVYEFPIADNDTIDTLPGVSANYSYWRQYPFRPNEPYWHNYWPRNIYTLKPSRSSQRDDFPKVKSSIRKHN